MARILASTVVSGRGRPVAEGLERHRPIANEFPQELGRLFAAGVERVTEQPLLPQIGRRPGRAQWITTRLP
jgi:hypothetical protein